MPDDVRVSKENQGAGVAEGGEWADWEAAIDQTPGDGDGLAMLVWLG